MSKEMATGNMVRRTPRNAKCSYKVGELFAGAGGMALGAHKARYKNHGFEHVWVNDMNKEACETFARNFEIDPDQVHCGKVENLNIEELSPIDGLAFGFPCNDFSVVNDREGISGKYGGLYQYGVEVLKQKKPSFFVAENVSGITSSGKDFEIIRNALVDAGYDVFDQIYKFEEYGVPQRRHRIILVGFRKDLGIEFQHPAPTHKENPLTVQKALSGIRIDAPNHEFTDHKPIVVERLKHIKPGENAFTAKLPEHLKLDLKSGAKISQIYKRLNPDKPSYTITGSGGGGTHVYHWQENRALTNRERARLQSFPDDFVFKGKKESIRKQIGMAVPPVGAEVVFKSILRTLVGFGIKSDA